MALVIAATSLGECVPTGASRGAADAAVLTEVLTDEPDAATPDDTDAAAPEEMEAARSDRGLIEDGTDPGLLLET